MIEQNEVSERLLRFYGEVRAQQSEAIPAWNPPSTRRRRQPLAALVAAGFVLVAGVIAFAVHDARQHVTPIGSPSPFVSPSVISPPYRGQVVLSAQFVDSSHGWAITRTGFYLTSNGGASWTTVSPPIEGVRTAYFLDAFHGWAIGLTVQGNSSSFDSILPVLITTDGGKTWTRHDLKIPKYQVGDVSLDFIDPTHGWLVAVNTTGSNFTSGMLFRTVDAGVTWKALVDANGLPTLPDGHPVRFINATMGWNVGSSQPGFPGYDTLYVTHDGGSSWTPVPIAIGATTVGYFSLPTFLDSAHGVLPLTLPTINTQHFYVTDDGGRTWALKESQTASALGGERINLANLPLPLPVAVTGRLSWLSAWGRHLEVAVNGNIVSIEPQGFPQVDELQFVTPSVGWALTTQTDSCQGFKSDCVTVRYMIHTVDGGRSWMPVDIP